MFPQNSLLSVSQAEVLGNFLSMMPLWCGLSFADHTDNRKFVEVSVTVLLEQRTLQNQYIKRQMQKELIFVHKFGSSKGKHIIFNGLHFILRPTPVDLY